MRVLWLTLIIVLVDQVTKVWVKTSFYMGESIPIIGEWFRFTFTENPGMAFGLSLGSKLFLTLFSVAATFLIIGYLWVVRKGPLSYRVALALVVGGALGNVIDRVFYGTIFGDYADRGYLEGEPGRLFYGRVVDFIHLDLGVLTVPEAIPFIGGAGFRMFPIGNVADLAIIAGVVLVIVFQKKLVHAAQTDTLAPRDVPEERAARVPGAASGAAPNPPAVSADAGADETARLAAQVAALTKGLGDDA